MDPEAKKLVNAPTWAESGDRVDPDDPSITPTLIRTKGWTAPFSTTDTPARQRINQLEHEQGAAIKELILTGIPVYDAELPYPIGAICQQSGDLWSANAAHNPQAPIAPLDAGQTLWRRIGGHVYPTRDVPDEITPSAIFAINDRNDKIEVLWAPPADGGYPILATELQYSKTDTFPSADTSTHDSYISGETIPISTRDADLFYIRMRARNAAGWGAYTAHGVRVRSTPPPPNAVINLQATTRLVSNSVQLTWVAPESNGLTITGYEVQWRTGGQAYDASRLLSLPATERIYAVPNLTHGLRYYFRVNSISNRGTKNTAGTEVSAIPDTAYPAAPGRPTLDRRSDTVTSATAYIAHPVEPNGQRIQWYQWRVAGADYNFADAVPFTTTEAFTTVTDMTTNKYVIVQAYNGVGDTSGTGAGGAGYGPYSGVLELVPALATPPSNIHIRAVRIGNTIQMWLASDIEWNGGTFVGMDVAYTNLSAVWPGETTITTSVTQPYTTITTGLDPVATYGIWAHVRTTGGTASAEEQIALRSVASAPSKPVLRYSSQFTADGRRDLIVWISDINDNFSPITKYEWEYAIQANGVWGTPVASSGSSAIVDRRLHAAGAIRFRARAYNALEWGAWSVQTTLLEQSEG